MKLSQTETYRNELCKVLRQIPDCINYEQLLLFSALVNKRKLELYDCNQDEIKDAKEELQAVKDILSKYIKGYKKSKISCFETDTNNEEYRINYVYTYEDLKNDLKRFVGNRYVSDNKIKFFRENVLSGKLLLSDFPKQVLDLLYFSEEEYRKVLELDEQNMIFYLNGKNKEEVNSFLLGQENVSINVLMSLFSNEKVERQDIINLFINGKINLASVQEFKDIAELEKGISNKQLYELYLNSKTENEDDKKAFNRYVLLYREIILKGKSEEEVRETMNDFVTEIMEEYDIEDDEKFLEDFYNTGIISANILFEWGDQAFIDKLIVNNRLKRADIKKMYIEKNQKDRNKFILVLKRALSRMDNTEKLNYIYSVFDGDSTEETTAREELEQVLYMDSEKIYGSSNGSGQRRRGNNTNRKNVRNYITMPRSRWKLISLLDTNYESELLADSHVIFKLPNANNGEIVIEKLYEKKGDRIVPSYGQATYILSEEEFVSNDIIIEENGKKYVDRKKLMELARDGKATKFVHSKNWGRAIKDYFGVEKENSIYSKEDIEQIDKAISSIEKSRQEI